MMNKLSESRLLLESHFLMKIRPLFLQNSPTALVIKRERKKCDTVGAEAKQNQEHGEMINIPKIPKEHNF